MKKYLGLLLCLSLFLTACGKDETTNSKSETVESTTSASTEAIEGTTSIVTTEAETEASTNEQMSEKNNEIMQGVQWNDDIETVKSSMNAYISSFEESNTDDITGVTQTYLAYMDVELCGETLDVSFLFTDNQLTQISYTYIQSTTKTKSLEDWSVIIAETYGEHSSVESAGFYSLYTWDSIMDNSAKLELSSFDGGVNIDVTTLESNANQESNESFSENPTVSASITDSQGRVFYNKKIDEFFADYAQILKENSGYDFNPDKSRFIELEIGEEDKRFMDKAYYMEYGSDNTFKGDDPYIVILVAVNEEDYIAHAEIAVDTFAISKQWGQNGYAYFRAFDAALVPSATYDESGTRLDNLYSTASNSTERRAEEVVGNSWIIYEYLTNSDVFYASDLGKESSAMARYKIWCIN